MDLPSLLNEGRTRQEHTEHTGSDALRGSPDPSESAVTTATTAVQSPGQTPSPEKTLSLSNTTRSRSPKGNRRPWQGDSSRFILGMNPAVETHSVPFASTAGSGSYSNESPIDHPLRQQSPKSPKHKLSDSRGSQTSTYTLSSAASSAPHSRISSLSTVGGDIPYWLPNTQEAMLSNMDDSQRLSPTPVQASYDALPRAVDTGQTDTGYEEAGQADSGHDDTESAETGESGNEHTDAADDDAEQTDADRAGSGDTEVRDTDSEGLDAGEQHDGGQTDSGETGRNDSAALPASPALAPIQESGRATSPSDFLIRRNPGSSNAGSPSSSSPLESQHNYAPSTPFWTGPQDSAGSRAHKRTVSAPDFPAARAPAPPFTYSRDAPAQSGNDSPTMATGRNYRLGTIHEPSTAESLAEAAHTDNDSAYNGLLPAGSALAEDKPVTFTDLDSEPRCMYMENCMTGSQLRKAISHIFGRNKICTRQIPDNVWVHFCRKHYQRTRYRNVDVYAKVQCKLVIAQIKRVQAWSDINRTNKQSGVITGWTLAVRKREQRRINEKEDNRATGSKRPHPVHYPQGFGFDIEQFEEDPDYKSAQAIPPWLLEKCDHVYSTDQVLEIFRRIQDEVEKDVLRQIPDIEVLPSITHDPNAELHYRPYQKRKLDHKRAQSDTGVGQWYALPPGSTQPFTPGRTASFWSHRQAPEAFQHEKRQRLTGPDYPQYQPHMNSLPQRNEGRTVPTPWRPGLSASLPAAHPQRVGLPSPVQQLEATTQSSFGDVGRLTHQRSHSDVSSFQPLPSMAADSSVPRFTPVNSEHLPAPNYPRDHYEQQNPPRQASSFSPGLNGQWAQQNAYGGLSDSQSVQRPLFGAMPGTQRTSYGPMPGSSHNQGHAYGSETSTQLDSYSNYPPPQQHPSFPSGLASGPLSYYGRNPAPAPMAGRQGHARHQSSPAIGQLTQQQFGLGPAFHNTVVPEGYPPNNQGYGNVSQQSHAHGPAPKEERDA